jgi:hypothetical protein
VIPFLTAASRSSSMSTEQSAATRTEVGPVQAAAVGPDQTAVPSDRQAQAQCPRAGIAQGGSWTLERASDDPQVVSQPRPDQGRERHHRAAEDRKGQEAKEGAPLNAERSIEVDVGAARCGAAQMMEGFVPPQSLCRERLQTTRKPLRSRAVVGSVAGKGVMLNASGVTQEGERK